MIVHLYWADSPMSWLRYMTLATLRRHNPEATIVLHTSPVTVRKTWSSCESDEAYAGHDWRDRIADLDIAIETYVPPCDLAPQQAGDMCRWEVLAAGGVFCDMDIVWMAPLAGLPEGDALSCEKGILKIGLTSGAPGGLFERARELALLRMDPDAYQSLGVAILYELAFGRKLDAFREARGRDTLRLLGAKSIPMAWVHPLSPQQMDVARLPRTKGLHWYGGYEPSAELSRVMTPENWREYPGSIATALSRCGAI